MPLTANCPVEQFRDRLTAANLGRGAVWVLLVCHAETGRDVAQFRYAQAKVMRFTFLN